MSSPFISICIPAYHRTAHLRRLLESISVQTWRDLEIIITDDSKDDTVKQLVDEYAVSLPISYFKNKPTAGSPGNWNIAIQKARGEWIKLMHDDDWFASPDSLQRFAAVAKSAESDFIFSACTNIYASGKQSPQFLTGRRKKMLEENSLNLFFLNVIGHPSTVMHRRDDAILYDTQYKWVVDIDFYMRYLQKHGGYHYIPEILINIGTDETQLSFSCYKNPYVEVPEYLSLLAKFSPGLLLQHEYVFHCVWNLVRRFSLRSINMIRDLGYKGPLPDHLQSIIDYQRPIPHMILKQTDWSRALMKRCFRKIKTRSYKIH